MLRSVAGRSGRRLLPPEERLANVFGRSAFCALRAEQLAPKAFHAYLSDPESSTARTLYGLPPQVAIGVIRSMLLAEGGRAVPGMSEGSPASFRNFRRRYWNGLSAPYGMRADRPPRWTSSWRRSPPPWP